MTSFKTRVIGAVILVSLAVIFVPMLFKSPAERTGQVETPLSDKAMRAGQDRTPVTDAGPGASQRLEVPPMPEVPEFTIEEPTEPQMRYSDRAAEPGADRSAVEARGGADYEIERPAATPVEVPAADKAAPDLAGATGEDKPAAPPASVDRPVDAKPASSTGSRGSSTAGGDFGEAWTIQVGSFADQARAQKIRADLQKAGTAAYVQEVQMKNGSTMIRVYAGPMLERGSAEKLKVTLDKKLGVNSLIMRYRPVQS